MNRNNQLGFTSYLLVVALSVGINYYLAQRIEAKVSSVPNYEYTPDTLVIKEVVKLQPIVGNYTNPETVRVFYNDTGLTNIAEIIPDLENMRIRIALLEDTIDVYKEYLAQFPKASKLVDLEVSQDSLNITILPNTGIGILEKKYPLYFQEFNYRFHEDSLWRIPVERNLTSPPRLLYRATGGLSYDMVPMGPSLDFAYERYWKWAIPFGEVNLIPTAPRYSSVKVGVKFDLLKAYE